MTHHARPRAGRFARHLGRSGGRAAWLVHLIGALALFAGLLLPLTDAGQALASPAIAQRHAQLRAQARAQEGDAVLITPAQVVAVGDFQNQLGCADFDATCTATQLSSNQGIWTGVFPLSPGSYEVAFIVIAPDGQQATYGEDGPDSQPLTLDVGDSETGAFFSFNAHTNETRVEAVDALYTLETDAGVLPLAPDGEALTALVSSQGGDLNVQLQVNGEPTGEPQVVPLEFGPNLITLTRDGSILDIEALPYGTLSIQRTGDDGQPLPGACYQVLSGNDIVDQGCDVDDGAADGSTLLTFPEGLESGDYTLVEVLAPDGADAADDQDITLQAGDNTVQIQAGDAGAGNEADDAAETPEATDESPGIVGTTEEAGDEASQPADATRTAEGETPGATQEEATGEPGDLIVTLQDAEGNPVGGACFELLRGDDVVAEACDTTDPFPNNGNSGFFGVASGTYTLRQSTTPEGSTTVDDREVEVRPNQEVTETIEVGQDNTATTAAVSSGDVVVLRQDAEGNPVGGACFEIVGADDSVIGRQVCDEDGDVADDGRTGFFDIPAGAATLRETRSPDGFEPAADQPFEIQGDAVTEVTVRSALIATEEPTAQPTEEPTAEPTEEATADATSPAETPVGGDPGDLIVTAVDDAGAPIAGACFELVRGDEVVADSCDADDPFPGNGNTGFFGVPSGTYTLRQSQVPEGTTPSPEQEVEIAAGEERRVNAVAGAPTVEPTTEPTAQPTEEPTPTAQPTEEATAEPTATPEPNPTDEAADLGPPGSLIITLQDAGGAPIGGACFELVQGEEVIADSCDADDAFPDNGRTGFFGVPSGTFTLRQSQVPEGSTAIAEVEVTVPAGDEADQTVQPAGDAGSPTQTAEPTATEADDQADLSGETAVRVDVSTVDAAGGPICVELNTSGGIQLAEAPAACDNGDGDADPAGGTILIEDVPPGEFAIFVTEGPDEVTQQDLPSVQVTEGETVDVTIQPGTPAEPTATAEPGAVEVTVTDASGAAITETGTCLAVGDVSGTVCDNEDGDANSDPGVVRVDANPAGTYTVSQSEAPAGFEIAEPVEDVVVEAGEVTGVSLVLVASAPESGTIAITVVDSEDQPVGGACFDVTNDSGTFNFCDDDGDGRIDIPDVVFGTQTVAQTGAGDGYAIDPEPQTVDVTAQEPAAELTFRNAIDAAVLPVIAVDADGTALGGACWTLSGDAGEFGPLCDDGAGSAATGTGAFRFQGADGDPAVDGEVRFEDIPSGTYILSQTQAPAGYTPVADQDVTVVPGENEPVEVTHEPAPITVEVTTTDAEGGILPGACYTIDGRDPLCDVDGDAIVNLEDVPEGDHTISQTTAPEGFAAAADQAITVERGDQPRVTFVNDAPLAGSVLVTLVDEQGESITNACVAFGDAVAICDNAPEDLDDADGTILTDGLTPGEYSVSVTDLPEGYDTPDARTATVEANETTSIEFTVLATAPETGNLTVAVRTDGGEAVGGTCVVLTRDGTVLVGPVCDNAEGDGDEAEGTIALADIETGIYTVSLTPESTGAIDGFQSSDSPSVEIGAGGTVETVITVVISVEPQAGTVQIVTRDNATGSRVADACYALSGPGEPIVACDGGSQDQNGIAGIIQLADIPSGDYSVTMDTVPPGYNPAPEEGLTVDAGVVNGIEIRIDPLPEAGSLVVSKVDGSGQPLGGACFAVQQDGVTIASVCDAIDASPNDGELEFVDLAPGSYRLVETQVSSTAYAAADPVAFEIVAGQTTELTVTNTPNPGRLVVTKVDAADASVRLPNACFLLQGDQEYGPFCDGDDRSEDGRTVFANVVPGDYQLIETVPPAGYVVTEPREIAIEPGASLRVTVANEVAPPPEESGTLIVYKQDASRDALPGGCFRLFDGEMTVTGRVCDDTDGTNDGTITFDDVPVGTWILRETLAPSPSYQIADDRDVTIANGETTEVSVVNTLKPGRVLVNKTNPEGQALQDACFDLGSDGNDARCTDAAGVVIFSNLVPGSYVLTETSAPFGYEEVDPVRDIAVQPGQTTVLNIVNERIPPPANTGSIQVQKFYCPAGDAGERTQFLGGTEGATQLSKTAGCDKGNAAFTLVGEDGSGGPGEFSTGDDGQYQVTVPEGVYILTETDPDLAGSSSVRVRVFTGQLTTVIVINEIAPPEPEPATINVAKYTCTPSFNGTLYEDFAQNCSSTELLTNDITVRAEGPVTARAVTGDSGRRGETSFTGLTPGRYTIYEERPYSIPTDYLFCGFDGDWPADYKAVNGRLEIDIDYGQTLTCRFFNIPEDLTETTGTILVRKYVCEVTDPPKGYDWESECRLSDQGSSFELSPYDRETEEYGDITTAQANPDGLLRFTRLEPGEYRLREANATWCHAESNSVNSRGDVVVQANRLAEVWIYNCVDTSAPPNTGSGDAAGWVTPGGEDGNSGMTVLLGIAWPVLAVAGWSVRHQVRSRRSVIRRHAA